MIFSLKLFVMLKILSSEYQLYACGKIFRMPRIWTKIFILQEAQMSQSYMMEWWKNETERS